MHSPSPWLQVAFWQRPCGPGGRVAILDGRTGDLLTYQDLYNSVGRAAEALKSPQKKLALLLIGNDVDGLRCYLALLAAGYTIWLWPHDRLTARGIDLIERYRPDAILWRHPELQLRADAYPERQTLFGYTLCWCRVDEEQIHDDLALLLPTSGSTGNPRLVRLSYSNVAANAVQIVKALEIEPNERWLCSLPFHYVFGLSVVNSVLAAGATLVLGDKTVMQQDYWSICRTYGVTALPAIPSQLKLMQEVRHIRENLTTFHKIAISGGTTPPAVRRWLTEELVPDGVQIYSMYGMTEAAGRIAVLPAREFEACPGSVGRAVEGGVLRILQDGNIEYTGPNVMMGYADERAQLALGDELGGVLCTGDLGQLDESGRLYVTGRSTRICKLFGIRIDLDDVEALCEQIAPVATVSNDSLIYIFYTPTRKDHVQSCLKLVASSMRIPIVAFVAREIGVIPRTPSGKTHYRQLLDLV